MNLLKIMTIKKKMRNMIIKPNIKKQIKDSLLLGVFITAIFLINPISIYRSLLAGGGITLFIFIVNVFIIGFLPIFKILREKEILYRSDYGVKHFVKIDKIKKITKSSGAGGYRHALYINYVDDSGKERSLKIKSSIFKKEDIVDFIKYIKSKTNIQTNKELEDFIV